MLTASLPRYSMFSFDIWRKTPKNIVEHIVRDDPYRSIISMGLYNKDIGIIEIGCVGSPWMIQTIRNEAKYFLENGLISESMLDDPLAASDEMAGVLPSSIIRDLSIEDLLSISLGNSYLFHKSLGNVIEPKVQGYSEVSKEIRKLRGDIETTTPIEEYIVNYFSNPDADFPSINNMIDSYVEKHPKPEGTTDDPEYEELYQKWIESIVTELSSRFEEITNNRKFGIKLPKIMKILQRSESYIPDTEHMTTELKGATDYIVQNKNKRTKGTKEKITPEDYNKYLNRVEPFARANYAYTTFSDEINMLLDEILTDRSRFRDDMKQQYSSSEVSTNEILKKIEPLLKSGNKIEAVKTVRKLTGWSVAQANEFVESPPDYEENVKDEGSDAFNKRKAIFLYIYDCLTTIGTIIDTYHILTKRLSDPAYNERKFSLINKSHGFNTANLDAAKNQATKLITALSGLTANLVKIKYTNSNKLYNISEDPTKISEANAAINTLRNTDNLSELYKQSIAVILELSKSAIDNINADKYVSSSCEKVAQDLDKLKKYVPSLLFGSTDYCSEKLDILHKEYKSYKKLLRKESPKDKSAERLIRGLREQAYTEILARVNRGEIGKTDDRIPRTMRQADKFIKNSTNMLRNDMLKILSRARVTIEDPRNPGKFITTNLSPYSLSELMKTHKSLENYFITYETYDQDESGKFKPAKVEIFAKDDEQALALAKHKGDFSETNYLANGGLNKEKVRIEKAVGGEAKTKTIIQSLIEQINDKSPFNPFRVTYTGDRGYWSDTLWGLFPLYPKERYPDTKFDDEITINGKICGYFKNCPVGTLPIPTDKVEKRMPVGDETARSIRDTSLKIGIVKGYVELSQVYYYVQAHAGSLGADPVKDVVSTTEVLIPLLSGEITKGDYVFAGYIITNYDNKHSLKKLDDITRDMKPSTGMLDTDALDEIKPYNKDGSPNFKWKTLVYDPVTKRPHLKWKDKETQLKWLRMKMNDTGWDVESIFRTMQQALDSLAWKVHRRVNYKVEYEDLRSEARAMIWDVLERDKRRNIWIDAITGEIYEYDENVVDSKLQQIERKLTLDPYNKKLLAMKQELTARQEAIQADPEKALEEKKREKLRQLTSQVEKNASKKGEYATFDKSSEIAQEIVAQKLSINELAYEWLKNNEEPGNEFKGTFEEFKEALINPENKFHDEAKITFEEASKEIKRVYRGSVEPDKKVYDRLQQLGGATGTNFLAFAMVTIGRRLRDRAAFGIRSFKRPKMKYQGGQIHRDMRDAPLLGWDIRIYKMFDTSKKNADGTVPVYTLTFTNGDPEDGAAAKLDGSVSLEKAEDVIRQRLNSRNATASARLGEPIDDEFLVKQEQVITSADFASTIDRGPTVRRIIKNVLNAYAQALRVPGTNKSFDKFGDIEKNITSDTLGIKEGAKTLRIRTVLDSCVEVIELSTGTVMRVGGLSDIGQMEGRGYEFAGTLRGNTTRSPAYIAATADQLEYYLDRAEAGIGNDRLDKDQRKLLELAFLNDPQASIKFFDDKKDYVQNINGFIDPSTGAFSENNDIQQIMNSLDDQKQVFYIHTVPTREEREEFKKRFDVDVPETPHSEQTYQIYFTTVLADIYSSRGIDATGIKLFREEPTVRDVLGALHGTLISNKIKKAAKEQSKDDWYSIYNSKMYAVASIVRSRLQNIRGRLLDEIGNIDVEDKKPLTKADTDYRKWKIAKEIQGRLQRTTIEVPKEKKLNLAERDGFYLDANSSPIECKVKVMWSQKLGSDIPCAQYYAALNEKISPKIVHTPKGERLIKLFTERDVLKQKIDDKNTTDEDRNKYTEMYKTASTEPISQTNEKGEGERPTQQSIKDTIKNNEQFIPTITYESTDGRTIIKKVPEIEINDQNLRHTLVELLIQDASGKEREAITKITNTVLYFNKRLMLLKNNVDDPATLSSLDEFISLGEGYLSTRQYSQWLSEVAEPALELSENIVNNKMYKAGQEKRITDNVNSMRINIDPNTMSGKELRANIKIVEEFVKSLVEHVNTQITSDKVKRTYPLNKVFEYRIPISWIPISWEEKRGGEMKTLTSSIYVKSPGIKDEFKKPWSDEFKNYLVHAVINGYPDFYGKDQDLIEKKARAIVDRLEVNNKIVKITELDRKAKEVSTDMIGLYDVKELEKYEDNDIDKLINELSYENNEKAVNNLLIIGKAPVLMKRLKEFIYSDKVLFKLKELGQDNKYLIKYDPEKYIKASLLANQKQEVVSESIFDELKKILLEATGEVAKQPEVAKPEKKPVRRGPHEIEKRRELDVDIRQITEQIQLPIEEVRRYVWAYAIWQHLNSKKTVHDSFFDLIDMPIADLTIRMNEYFKENNIRDQKGNIRVFKDEDTRDTLNMSLEKFRMLIAKTEEETEFRALNPETYAGKYHDAYKEYVTAYDDKKDQLDESLKSLSMFDPDYLVKKCEAGYKPEIEFADLSGTIRTMSRQEFYASLATAQSEGNVKYIINQYNRIYGDHVLAKTDVNIMIDELYVDDKRKLDLSAHKKLVDSPEIATFKAVEDYKNELLAIYKKDPVEFQRLYNEKFPQDKDTIDPKEVHLAIDALSKEMPQYDEYKKHLISFGGNTNEDAKGHLTKLKDMAISNPYDIIELYRSMVQINDPEAEEDDDTPECIREIIDGIRQIAKSRSVIGRKMNFNVSWTNEDKTPDTITTEELKEKAKFDNLDKNVIENIKNLYETYVVNIKRLEVQELEKTKNEKQKEWESSKDPVNILATELLNRLDRISATEVNKVVTTNRSIEKNGGTVKISDKIYRIVYRLTPPEQANKVSIFVESPDEAVKTVQRMDKKLETALANKIEKQVKENRCFVSRVLLNGIRASIILEASKEKFSPDLIESGVVSTSSNKIEEVNDWRSSVLPVTKNIEITYGKTKLQLPGDILPTWDSIASDILNTQPLRFTVPNSFIRKDKQKSAKKGSIPTISPTAYVKQLLSVIKGGYNAYSNILNAEKAKKAMLELYGKSNPLGQMVRLIQANKRKPAAYRGREINSYMQQLQKILNDPESDQKQKAVDILSDMYRKFGEQVLPDYRKKILVKYLKARSDMTKILSGKSKDIKYDKLSNVDFLKAWDNPETLPSADEMKKSVQEYYNMTPEDVEYSPEEVKKQYLHIIRKGAASNLRNKLIGNAKALGGESNRLLYGLSYVAGNLDMDTIIKKISNESGGKLTPNDVREQLQAAPGDKKDAAIELLNSVMGSRYDELLKSMSTDVTEADFIYQSDDIDDEGVEVDEPARSEYDFIVVEIPISEFREIDDINIMDKIQLSSNKDAFSHVISSEGTEAEHKDAEETWKKYQDAVKAQLKEHGLDPKDVPPWKIDQIASKSSTVDIGASGKDIARIKENEAEVIGFILKNKKANTDGYWQPEDILGEIEDLDAVARMDALYALYTKYYPQQDSPASEWSNNDITAAAEAIADEMRETPGKEYLSSPQFLARVPAEIKIGMMSTGRDVIFNGPRLFKLFKTAITSGPVDIEGTERESLDILDNPFADLADKITSNVMKGKPKNPTKSFDKRRTEPAEHVTTVTIGGREPYRVLYMPAQGGLVDVKFTKNEFEFDYKTIATYMEKFKNVIMKQFSDAKKEFENNKRDVKIINATIDAANSIYNALNTDGYVLGETTTLDKYNNLLAGYIVTNLADQDNNVIKLIESDIKESLRDKNEKEISLLIRNEFDYKKKIGLIKTLFGEEIIDELTNKADNAYRKLMAGAAKGYDHERLQTIIYNYFGKEIEKEKKIKNDIIVTIPDRFIYVDKYDPESKIDRELKLSNGEPITNTEQKIEAMRALLDGEIAKKLRDINDKNNPEAYDEDAPDIRRSALQLQKRPGARSMFSKHDEEWNLDRGYPTRGSRKYPEVYEKFIEYNEQSLREKADALERGEKPYDFEKATMPSRQMDLPSAKFYNDLRFKTVTKRKNNFIKKASKIYQHNDGSPDTRKIINIWDMLVQRLDPLIVTNENDKPYMDRSEWIEQVGLDKDYYVETLGGDKDQFAIIIDVCVNKAIENGVKVLNKDGKKTIATREQITRFLAKKYKTDIKGFWKWVKKYAPDAVREYETADIEDINLEEPEDEIESAPEAVTKAEMEPEPYKAEHEKNSARKELQYRLENAKEAEDVGAIDKYKALLDKFDNMDFKDFMDKYRDTIMKEHNCPPVHMMLEAIRRNVPSITIHALVEHYAKIGHISGVIDIYESTKIFIDNINNCTKSDLVAMICESTRKLYCEWEQPWSRN